MKGFYNNRKRKRNFNGNILIMNHPFQLHAAAIAIANAIPITGCKWIYTTDQPTPKSFDTNIS